MENEDFNKLKACKNKTEAYKAFKISPNSKGILKLKEIAFECGFDLDEYILKKKKGICENCGISFTKEKSHYRFCSQSCAAIFNNKKRPKKTLSDEEINEKRITSNKRKVELRRLKDKICIICGSRQCSNLEVCKHPRKWFEGMQCFGLDIDTIGTENINKEYFKLKDLLYKEYFDNLLSPHDIAKKYGYDKSYENILHILKSLDFNTRNISNSITNSLLSGKGKLTIKDESNYQFKHGWHTTWDGKKVYYRSSYELKYAEKLDEEKEVYEMENFRIKYWDSTSNRYRIAIPDFYIKNKNKIIEIKSTITFIKQNMIDKFDEYKKIGFTPILILENEEYGFDEIKNIIEGKITINNFK